MDEKVISCFASGKATALRNHLILFRITFKDSIIFSIISYSYKLKIKQFLPQPSAVGLCPFLLPEEVLIVFWTSVLLFCLIPEIIERSH